MVLITAITFIAIFVLWGVFSPGTLGTASGAALSFTTSAFGWYYLLAALGFLLFCIYLALSRYGSIKLGRDDEEPEFSTFSWFSMLFSAGMGIGLVFWGVAEPVSHFLAPPQQIEAETAVAARAAMKYSFFHWGLHPWAIYSVVALSIAFFSFRKGQPTLISTTFRPLLGDRVLGWPGKLIDLLAILATVFGVATSLGLGALQINSGLASAFGVPTGSTMQVVIIAVVTVLFLISAVTGIRRGIQVLSNTNIVLASLLVLAVFLLGPTVFILNTLTTTIGGYVQDLIQLSTRLTPFSQATWVGGWTIFYWAWWIAWAPFVGLFIARVSRGRTIKEFITGVLLVPALVSFVWFSVFGGTALNFELFGDAGIAQAVKADVSTALFATLNALPLGLLLSIIATLLIASFFITSADSATYVLGMLSTQGNIDPSTKVKIVWGVLQSAIAVVLLLSGGLRGLQTASIVAALPFSLIMVGMCVSLLRALKQEMNQIRKREREERRAFEAFLRSRADENTAGTMRDG